MKQKWFIMDTLNSIFFSSSINQFLIITYTNLKVIIMNNNEDRATKKIVIDPGHGGIGLIQNKL